MLKDLIVKNRSTRGFDETYVVDRETLLDCIDCARLSASSSNIQPLKYYAASEKAKVAEILATTKWAGALSELHLPFPGTAPTAFIVILLDKSIDDHMARFQTDAGIAAQSITLAAVEKGLSCCMIKDFNAADLKEVLALPESLVPMMVIAVGKGTEKITLEGMPEDGRYAYYRTENNKHHHVPKRSLKEIVIE